MSRYLDLIERTLATFVQGFLATWVVTGDLDATTLKVAGMAGLIAAAKCLLAFQVGSPKTAALLPAGPDTDLGGDA